MELSIAQGSQTMPNISWVYKDKDVLPFKHELVNVFHDCNFGNVKIKFEDNIFKVHKAVLMATSLVFEAMLRSDFQEVQSNEIDVTQWFGDFESAKGFFAYLYTGIIYLNEANILFTLEVSRMMFLNYLESHCEQYLLQNLNTGNIISTIKTALNYELKDLLEICLKYLKNIEYYLPNSTELDFLTIEQLNNFLCSDAVKGLKNETVGNMILYWLQNDFDKRCSDALALLSNRNVTVQMLEGLKLSTQQKEILKKGLCVSRIADQIGTRSNGKQWTILIQEASGKTALFSPRNNAWRIFELPAMKKSKLIGLLEGHILAYVHENHVICINMMNRQRKESIISDERNVFYRTLNTTNPNVPSRYFCFLSHLYCIKPIESHGLIIGWGIYRYCFENNHWKVIFDIFVFSSESFSVDDIFDRSDEQQQRIASMCYNQDSQQTYTYSFIYNCQQSQYNSFTVISSHNTIANSVELPEVAFLNVDGTLYGFSVPTTDVQINCPGHYLKIKVSLFKLSDGEFTDILIRVSLPKDEKVPIQQTKEIAPTEYSHADSASAPFVYDLFSDKKIFLFNSRLYIAIHYHPFDFRVFYYSFHTNTLNFLPPLPTIFDENFIILPVNLTESTYSMMNTAESYSVLEACGKKWATCSWKGVFKIVDDCLNPSTSTD